jgi:hypothetical protein
MELIERVNLPVAKWLYMQTKQQLTYILKNKSDDPSTIDDKYNKLKNYLKSVIDTNGVIKKLYKYSLNSNNELGGRLFSKFGIQSIQRDFRGV